MADPFALLTGGGSVRFDKKRYQADFDAFRPPPLKEVLSSAGPSASVHAPAAKHPHSSAPKEGRRPGHKDPHGGGPDRGIKLFEGGAQADGEDKTARGKKRARAAVKGPSDDSDGDDDMGPAALGKSDQEEDEGHGEEGGYEVDPGCPVVHSKDIKEADNAVRKHYRIKVSGSLPPPPLRCWAQLLAPPKGAAASASGEGRGGGGLGCQTFPSGLVSRIRKELGHEQPTPVQRQVIPSLLAGREVLGMAPTGSGKTLAFMLPIIASLKALRTAALSSAPDTLPHAAAAATPIAPHTKGKAGKQKPVSSSAAPSPSSSTASPSTWPTGVKAVVLSPTNELAAQQARCLKLLLPGSGLKGSLLTKSTSAGTDFSKVDVLLANPLRLLGLIQTKKVDLSQARFLILDEADKLFEMGFLEQVDGIIAACTHPDVVRALFSATLPEKVEELARSVLQDPLRITVGVRNSAAVTVKQRLLFVGREAGKLMALRQLVQEGLKPPVLVFVASKERAKALHRELLYDGVHVDSIHAEQSLASRAAAVDNFRLGRTWLLIATDLIGRGMDFIGVNTVVNYDMPGSTADYVHRVGRTGRAGHEGSAVTFFTEEDSGQLRSIANLVKASGGDVPDWMTSMKKVDPRDKKRRRLPSDVVPGARSSFDRRKGGPPGGRGGKSGSKGRGNGAKKAKREEPKGSDE